MPTITIFATTDGDITSGNVTYSTARSGSGLSLDDTAASMQVGQDQGGQYNIKESFMSFDTSTVVNPVNATLSLSLFTAYGTAFTTNVEARLDDYGATLTTADWVAGASLSGLTLLATLSVSDASPTNVYYGFTNSGSALLDNLNLSGSTRIILNQDLVRIGTAPGTGVLQEVAFYTSRDAGGKYPKLQVSVHAVSTDEILTPDLDIATNSWTTDTGGTTSLYAAIDELTASDTDYIQSPAAPTTAQYYETALETHADPLSSTGHIVHYRYQKNVAAGNLNLGAALIQGASSNQLSNPNFETDTSGWSGVGSAIARDTGQFRSGAASLKATNTTGAGTDVFVGTSGTGTSAIPCYSSGSITVSCWSKASITGRSIVLRALFIKSDGSDSGISPDVAVTTVANNTTGWTFIGGNVAAPSDAAYMRVFITIVASSNVGEDHYFDDFSLVLNSVTISSWTHTNISNTWTQQDQTLSGPQADSITDYSDLRLRFTPSTTTSDVVPTKVADRASANSNSVVTTVDLVLTSLTVGNYLIVRAAGDNSGGSGAARSFTPSNFSGTAMGTHTEYQQLNDPGAASAGVTCDVSVIKIAATSGTIRLTYSGSVVAAVVAEEWSGIDGTTPVVGTPVKANGVASLNLASLTDASIALGNVAYGAMAVEGPTSDTYTQDADSTNGTWTTVTKLGTSNATADTNMTTYGGYKAVTAAGAQTYNPTISVARDSAGIILELAAAPATIKTQVSWANLELPGAVTAIPRAIRRYLQAVGRAGLR